MSYEAGIDAPRGNKQRFNKPQSEDHFQSGNVLKGRCCYEFRLCQAKAFAWKSGAVLQFFTDIVGACDYTTHKFMRGQG
ncbi:MAG: hypothetical protein EG822_04265 [Deltaproteobacteria bacterium]|nr:hypothetical protein [Deltaproteobacteria bacterium]